MGLMVGGESQRVRHLTVFADRTERTFDDSKGFLHESRGPGLLPLLLDT